MKAEGRAFDPGRHFCETGELMHVGGYGSDPLPSCQGRRASTGQLVGTAL